jgi:hypothetical protein
MAIPILVTGAAGRVGAIGRTVTELLVRQERCDAFKPASSVSERKDQYDAGLPQYLKRYRNPSEIWRGML